MEKMFCEPIIKNILVITILLFVSVNSRPTEPVMSVNSCQPADQKDCLKDILVLLDTSYSIEKDNFELVQDFLISLAKQLNVSQNGVHFGFITFASKKKTRILLPFGKQQNQTELIKWLRKLNYEELKGKTTRTDIAFKFANEIFLEKSPLSHRPNVDDVVLLFTDGQPTSANIHSRYLNPLVANNSTKLKEKGVTIIGVAAGNADVEQIEKWSTKYFNTTWSEQSLKNLANTIVDPLCECVPPPPSTPTSSTTTPLSTTTPSSTTTSPSTTTPPTAAPTPTTTTPLTTTPTPTTTPPTTPTPPKDCPGSVGKDVLFVVDGTVHSQQPNDLAQEDFNKIEKFISSIIGDLNNDQFRVGVMQYTGKNKAKMEIDFQSPKMITKNITIKQQKGNKRYTGNALMEAINQFYVHNYLESRENNPDVIVLITRGTPNDREVALSEARGLPRHTKLITVGVHSGTSAPYLEAFLKNMTDKCTSLFKYEDLEKSRKVVLDKICDDRICPGKPETPSCLEGQFSQQDIFFVVDGSASIKNHNFIKVKNFLSRFISRLNLSAEFTDINTGLMQFSITNLTKVEWEIGKYPEAETKDKAQKITYQAGKKTEAGDALTRVISEIFTGKNGDRPDVNNTLILFTDGNAHDLEMAREQAKTLKDKGVRIITVAAGMDASVKLFQPILIEMASSPQYAITVNYDELNSFKFVDKVMKYVACPPEDQK